MKKLASLLCVTVLLTAAAAANADIQVYAGSIYDVYMTVPVPVGANPAGEALFGVEIKVVNISGDSDYDPAGFNGSSDPYTGFTTPVEAGFHQQEITGLVATAVLDGPPSNIATAIDTHFNFYAGDILSVDPPGDPDPGAPSETTNLAASVEPVDATGPFGGFATVSFGDRMFGTFSVIGGAAADVDGDGDPTTWNLLHIAAKWGTQVHMNFFMTGVKGPEIIVGDFNIVPEPATMGLLAMGGVAALLRRRR